MPIHSRHNESGFTLIEVVVAFLILGLAASAVLSVFNSSPAKVLRANNERLAILSAQSILALAATDSDFALGVHQEKLSDKVKWSVAVQPYGRTDNNADDDSAPTLVTIPYLVTATAVAGPVWNPVSVSITTLRLKIAAP